jgi:hypothetical protein
LLRYLVENNAGQRDMDELIISSIQEYIDFIEQYKDNYSMQQKDWK